MGKIDSVSRLPFAEVSLRKCPHPNVQARYGKDCYVSVYTCKRCQFGKRYPLMDGWGCEYGNNENASVPNCG